VLPTLCLCTGQDTNNATVISQGVLGAFAHSDSRNQGQVSSTTVGKAQTIYTVP